MFRGLVLNLAKQPFFLAVVVVFLGTMTIGHSQSKDTIQKAQRALAQAGFDPGPADGILGARTEEALRGYQREKGLNANGQANRETLESLGVDTGRRGLIGRVGGAVKSAGSTVGRGATTAAGAAADGARTGARAGAAGGRAAASGATTGARATAKGATVGAKATAEGATTGATAAAKGATVGAKAVATGATVGGRATAKGATVAAKGAASGVGAAKNAVTGGNDISRDPALIRQVQEGLKREGFDPGPVDGLLGPRTRTALRRYQGEFRLNGNGRVTRATLDQLGINAPGQ